MARGGLARLQQHEKEVNKLNVFPVADGDTGTNMCATLGNGIAYARPAERLSDYLKMLSEGMLLGARGNSGVILSQFFKGVYLALNDCGEADPKALAKALLQGSQTAYQSVIKPVEGTILTVMREGIENIKAPSTAEELLTRYIARMKRSLARTPDLLPVLRESGVIDSGGKGLIYIAEGMLMALTGEELPEIEETPIKQTLDFSLFDENSVMNEGYCTEFILQLLLARQSPRPHPYAGEGDGARQTVRRISHLQTGKHAAATQRSPARKRKNAAQAARHDRRRQRRGHGAAF